MPLDKLARIAALFGVLALAMAMAYLFAPEAVSNSVGRLLQPNREDFFSYTKLNVEPGDLVIRRGDAMQVRFTTSGRAVTRAAVEVRQTGASFAAEVGWSAASAPGRAARSSTTCAIASRPATTSRPGTPSARCRRRRSSGNPSA